MAITITQLETLADKWLFSGKSYEDQTFSDNVVVDILLKKLAKKHSGGERISASIRHGKLPVSSYDADDTINRFHKEMWTRADYNWKFYVVSAVVYDTELKLINGEEQIIDYVAGLEDNMLESLGDKISDHFYSDGTGNNGKDFAGLDALFDQTTTAYGGISSSDISDWQAGYDNTAYSISSDIDKIVKKINLLPRTPSMILTSLELWMAFWKLINNKTSIQDGFKGKNAKAADRMAMLGVEAINLNGIPIVYDKKLDNLSKTSQMYVLNEKYLAFAANPKQWFTPINTKEGWRMAEKSLVWFQDYGVSLQLTTNRRNAHLLFNNVSA